MKYRILKFLYVNFGLFAEKFYKEMHAQMAGRGVWRRTASNMKESACNHKLNCDDVCVKCQKSFERIK